MDGRLYEIRWINENKRYGVFAKQEISSGTNFLDEYAVMVDVQPLVEILRFWSQIASEELSIHKSTQDELTHQTQQILTGMRTFEAAAKTNDKYKSAMEIHRQRLNNITSLEDRSLGLLMNLYRRAVNISFTDSQPDLLNPILEQAIGQINTFLHGIIHVMYPECAAWGPHSAFLNHACKPTALITVLEPPNPDSARRRYIGRILGHALTTIKENEEITIEYARAFGKVDERQKLLRRYGISNCSCVSCEYEERLRLLPNDTVAQQTLRKIAHDAQTTQIFFRNMPRIMNATPAQVYQSFHLMINSFKDQNYHGEGLRQVYRRAASYAQHFNDNIRLKYFAYYLSSYVKDAYGIHHEEYRSAHRTFQQSFQGIVWNEGNRNLLTLCDVDYVHHESNERLVFMLDNSVISQTYNLILINSEGRLAPISAQDNLANVLQKLALWQVQAASEQETDHDDDKDSIPAEPDEAAKAAAADLAAAELIAEEARDAARKDKMKRKKKAKTQRTRDKKKAANEELERQATAAAAAAEAKLAARVAAVRAAVVVPALPRSRPRLPPPPSSPSLPLSLTPLSPSSPSPSAPPPPPPHHRRFRSSSLDEWATIERFLQGTPLRPDPAEFEDCVSDGGVLLRYGISVRRAVEEEEKGVDKRRFLGWYVRSDT